MTEHRERACLHGDTPRIASILRTLVTGYGDG